MVGSFKNLIQKGFSMLSKIYINDDTPGSLSNINEIKILICYTIKMANRPLDQNQLNEVFQINKTVNYFNFCAAVEELLETHHLMKTSDQKLSLTKLGSDAAELFQQNLPYSTIKKTFKTLKKISERDRQNKNRKISTKRSEDGFIVNLTIEETGTNLIELGLFCSTKNEAEKFENEFKNKTTEIYRAIVAMLTNDFRSLTKITEELKEKHKKSQETKMKL